MKDKTALYTIGYNGVVQKINWMETMNILDSKGLGRKVMKLFGIGLTELLEIITLGTELVKTMETKRKNSLLHVILEVSSV